VMPDEPLTVTLISQPATRAMRVCVMGDVDEVTAPMLREVLSSAIAKRPSRLEIDLNGATFLARAGLNELITARSACAGEVVLVGANQTVRGLLRVLDAEFDVA